MNIYFHVYFRMDIYRDHSLFELKLSTNSSYCRNLGGGRYEFNLPFQELKFGIDNMRIGLKDLELPLILKTVEFNVALVGQFQKYESNLLKKFQYSFDSHETLADYLETMINAKFQIGNVACLNFSSPHEKHICSNVEKLVKKVQITFKRDRFFIDKVDDFKIALSLSVCKMMKIDMYASEVKDDILLFEDNCIVSHEKVIFLEPPQDRLNIALFNCIKSYFVTVSGQKIPVFYSTKVENHVSRQTDKIIALGRMSNRTINKFEIGFFNNAMYPYYENVDLKLFPVCLTLVFMKPI